MRCDNEEIKPEKSCQIFDNDPPCAGLILPLIFKRTHTTVSYHIGGCMIERLKEILDYNPETGLFTWKEKRKWSKEVGSVAGYVNTHHITGRKYIHIHTLGKQWNAHRLAFIFMTGKEPNGFIDHINGNGLDNRWVNLRDTDCKTNSRNARRRKEGIGSGVMGVRWCKPANKWIAGIHHKGKNVHLGLFVDFDDAVKARKNAEIKYRYSENHGEKQKF